MQLPRATRLVVRVAGERMYLWRSALPKRVRCGSQHLQLSTPPHLPIHTADLPSRSYRTVARCGRSGMTLGEFWLSIRARHRCRDKAHPRYQDPPARRGGAGISTGRRTRQILSVSSVAPVSSWSRQQAEKRIRVAAGALFENRADNKLARMSVVMLHVKTVALVSSPCLNGAITPQHTVVVLKRALNIEEFDHY